MNTLLECLRILSEIVLACLPIFLVMVGLEKLSDKLSKKMMNYDFQGFADRKLKRAKENEKQAWAQRGKEIEKRDTDA